MHLLSRKDLSSEKLETLQKSKTPRWILQVMEQSCHQANHAKNMVIPASGPVVESQSWSRMGNEFCAIRKTSFLLLYQDCHQAPAQVRLQHRSRSTHRELLRVQQDYEVTTLTLKHRETEAILDCEISWKGKRSSQKISKTQVPAPVNTSRDSDSECLMKVATRKHSFETHFPGRPKLRNLKANQDCESPRRRSSSALRAERRNIPNFH